MIFALLGIFAGTGNAASTISAVAASSASSDSLSSLCQGVDHNSISEFTSATISKFCEDFPHTLSATSYVPCVASESEGFYPRDVLAAEDVEKEVSNGRQLTSANLWGSFNVHAHITRLASLSTRSGRE